MLKEQAAPKEFVGEGIVVAFQKYNRYPVMGPVRGIANFAEFWVVRFDKRTNEDEPLKEKKYFRVEYNIYERGLTVKSMHLDYASNFESFVRTNTPIVWVLSENRPTMYALLRAS